MQLMRRASGTLFRGPFSFAVSPVRLRLVSAQGQVVLAARAPLSRGVRGSVFSVKGLQPLPDKVAKSRSNAVIEDHG